MIDEIKNLIERRNLILQDLLSVSLDGKRLQEEKEKLDEEFFSRKINSIEYSKRKQKFESFNWETEYYKKIELELNELKEIDKKLLHLFSNLEKEFETFTYVYKAKFSKVSSYFKQKEEEFEKFKQKKDTYFESKAMDSISDVQSINREILLKYEQMLKKNSKKVSELKPIELKKIDWNAKSDEIYVLDETEVKKLPFFAKIKYWYYKKFLLPKIIRNKTEQMKSNKEIDLFSKESINQTNSLLELVKFGEEQRKKEKEEEKSKTYLLDEEIVALQKLLKTENNKKEEEFKIPIFFMFIINLISSNISLFLIKQFPEYFENLYKKIQIANLKILPSIYINILIFTSLVLGFLFFIIGMLVGLVFLKMPFVVAFGLGWLLAIIGIFLIVVVFTEYPNSVITERMKSIETNLPFAIIHMSSIAGSGVVPLKMFELVAERKDFGAVSEEFERIVKYVNLFGVDLITAIRETLDLTPSTQLKDFLNGLITSIESGGDLILYLTVKANEILDLYKIKREKVNDNISVFSEMYMGIMITAPIFFVLVISMIGFLGAQIGGISAPIMLGIFTYVIFPLLNFAFFSMLDKILLGY